MKKGLRPVSILIAVLLISSAGTSEKIKVKIEDGVEVVYNPKNPDPPKDTATKISLREEFSIGKGKKEEEMFSELTFFAIDSKGQIYVLDSKESAVKVFDAQGKYLRSFGKKGQGPGEMNQPVGIQVTPSGEIVVEDIMNQRLVYFSAEGNFLKTVSTAKVLGLSGIVFDSKGNIFARQFSMAEKRLIWEVKKYTPDLSPLYTIDSVDFPNPLEGKINPFRFISILYELSNNDYLFYGNTKDYDIRVFSPDGKLVRKILKDYNPMKITEEDKRDILSKIPDVGFGVKDRIVFPDYYPPYQLFSVDEEGRLIVRTNEKGKTKGEYYYDVFDPEGKYIAKILLRVTPRIWKGKKLYAIEETEDGYNILRCFNVTWKT